MSRLDDLFELPITPVLHPIAALWDELREVSGGEARLEFERRLVEIGNGPAQFIAEFHTPTGEQVDLQESLWDQGLHHDLVQLGFWCFSEQNEGERFGFAMHGLFEPVEARYGDGYFNAMLLNYLVEVGIDKLPGVSAVLKEVHRPTPSRDGVAFTECQSLIATVLGRVARDLTNSLGYERPNAERVLGAAVAYYLNDRFSVSLRQSLGFRGAAER